MKKRKGKKHIVETTEEQGFTDTKYLCVGIVDIVNDAVIVESEKIARYYLLFRDTITLRHQNI